MDEGGVIASSSSTGKCVSQESRIERSNFEDLVKFRAKFYKQNCSNAASVHLPRFRSQPGEVACTCVYVVKEKRRSLRAARASVARPSGPDGSELESQETCFF